MPTRNGALAGYVIKNLCVCTWVSTVWCIGQIQVVCSMVTVRTSVLADTKVSIAHRLRLLLRLDTLTTCLCIPDGATLK